MKKYFLILIIPLLFLVAAPLAIAIEDTGGPAPDYVDPGSGITLINPLGVGGGPQDLEVFLIRILDFIIRIGTIVVIVVLVYVGYMFVTAQGKPEELKTARKALFGTIIGALILLGAQAIAYAILATVEAISVGN